MRCPDCKETMKQIDTRPTRKGQMRRRRYECPACNKRFTTYEISKKDLIRYDIDVDGIE